MYYLKTALLFAAAMMLALPSVAADVWKGTWATAVEYPGQGDMPKESLSGRSCRQIIHVAMGGETVRLKLSNEFSDQPLEIKSVYIADATKTAWNVDAKSARYLKFGGKKNIAIQPHGAAYSDAMTFPLKSDQWLAVTVNYGEKTPKVPTTHRGSRTTSYIIKGETKAAASFDGAELQDHWYNIAALEVKAPEETDVIAVLGNSITDGRGSTTNLQNRWTDFFSTALNAKGRVGVLNLGIGGNCVVQGGLSQPALVRFDRDILGQQGVTKLIIFEGTNDIGTSNGNYEHLADTLIASYKVLIDKAHAKGIKVYGGTITPNKGNGWYSFWHEAVRQTVNEWIRNGKAFDGVIDFDALTRDPHDQQQLKPEYSDDWLHLNPKGYEAMGKYAATSL